MSGRMVRCREGHFFDVAASPRCPVCGDDVLKTSEAPRTGDAGSEGSGDRGQNGDGVGPQALIFGGIAVLATTVLVAAWLAFRGPSEPVASQERDDSPAIAADDTERGHAPNIYQGRGEEPSAAQSEGPSAISPDRVEDKASSKAASDSKAMADRLGILQRDNSGTSRAEPVPANARPNTTPVPLPRVTYPPEQAVAAQKALGLSDLLLDSEISAAAAEAMEKEPSPELAALLLKLADRGDVQSKVLLSNAYFSGRGVERNEQLGLRYLEEAAAAGHGPSRFALATLLLDGNVAAKDMERARALMILAAREGLPGTGQALVSMGVDPSSIGPSVAQTVGMCLEGKAEAIAPARQLIADKIAAGSLGLGWYAARFSTDKGLRREAPRLAYDAARLGLREAYQLLSMLYLDGVLVPQNLAESLIWLRRYRSLCGDAENCKLNDPILTKLTGMVDPEKLQRFFDVTSNIGSRNLQPR